MGLPESDDPRVLRAGLELLAENAVSSLYLFHDEKTCAQLCRNFDRVFDLQDPRIIWFNLRFYPEVAEVVQAIIQKGKENLLPLYVALYLLAQGKIDTVCAGATYLSADVIPFSSDFYGVICSEDRNQLIFITQAKAKPAVRRLCRDHRSPIVNSW